MSPPASPPKDPIPAPDPTQFCATLSPLGPGPFPQTAFRPGSSKYECRILPARCHHIKAMLK